jgi:TPR repeat protein
MGITTLRSDGRLSSGARSAVGRICRVAVVWLALAAAAWCQSPEYFKIRALAEEGDAKAQCSVGRCFLLGELGAPIDYWEAAKWFRMAAENGDSVAQAQIGFWYEEGNVSANRHEKGIPVPVDMREAIKWYR